MYINWASDPEVTRYLTWPGDYYNLIHRYNLNNYFLCKVKSFGDKNLTKDEIEDFHLSTLKMTYEEAIDEYEKRRATKLGRLIANRELLTKGYRKVCFDEQTGKRNPRS